MKYSILILSLFILSCSEKQEQVKPSQKEAPSKIIKEELGKILDSANLKGTILVYDVNKSTYYSNDFQEAKIGNLPASTFKIVNTIIGLESGNVDSSTIFKWNGEERALPSWEKDLSLKEAFQASCVPCYQELARNIGVDTMIQYLERLDFGNMDVNPENLDEFWLIGNSTINPFQQIDFLKRLYNNQLPIAASNTGLMKDIMRINVQENYSLYGKTGWSIRGSEDIGWFVGFVEKGEELFFFATKIKPNKGFDRQQFPVARVNVTMQALLLLGVTSY